MNTIAITHELPEGVTVETIAYRASHGVVPNTDGSWGFIPAWATHEHLRPANLDDVTVWITGTLLDAIDQLPEGAWQLLP